MVGVLVAMGVLVFSAAVSADLTDGNTGTPSTSTPEASHRLIVVLASEPLAVKYKSMVGAQSVDGRLDTESTSAQQYVAQLQAEQATFVNAMQSVMPDARVSSYIDEYGDVNQETFQIVMNAVVVEPAKTSKNAVETLSGLPGVKAVYHDYAYHPLLYTSTYLINAPAVWTDLGGRADAGRGVKVASMDGGVHKDAPMFSGDGFSYPPDPKYQPDGLGLTANNNGKIIASRVYFRTWDPPAPGDENPWPGENGTPHGNHTAGIAVGDVVTDATYAGTTLPPLSGVAPGAWVMSYRVFYYSVTGNGSFYTAEGIAALEDIVQDGADVVNNSWGGGPSSIGGEFDPLDQALINASNAGVFVAMSNGNAGPNPGTGDHPSSEYINVAASTTSGTYVSGRVDVTAPEPISPTLQDIEFGIALFGPSLTPGQVFNYSFKTAQSVDSTNVTGCSPFPANAFSGVAAVISRGDCNFSDKVYNAQQAGATFAVIYNNQGDDTLNMSCGSHCGPGEITISSIFIGQTAGLDMVDWYTLHGDDAELTVNTVAFQAGNTPDRIIGFSSRGPGVGNVLKPDIAAPGVNIMSQGFDPTATGEARHLGFGQASGTSMAAPHVAGSAALVRQAHPGWSNAWIKSALMSTSKYMDIYNADGTPAQPLDMGAGRLDLTNVMDPGVILNPPSVSFGLVTTGTVKSMAVQVRNVATATETYDLSTLYTGDGFTMTTDLAGVSVSPGQVTLAPNEVATVTVAFDPAQSMGYNDNQGFIVMDGDAHDAHMPVWARVIPAAQSAQVLVIDADLSPNLGLSNYMGYYTQTLTALGYTYDVWDASDEIGAASTIPDFATLTTYDAVLLFTGDNFYPNGSFTVSTPLTAADMDRLTEYANNGGTIMAMGQDMSSVLNDSFFDDSVLGDTQLQDSLSGNSLPSLPVVALADAPAAFADISLDLSGPDTYLATVNLSASSVVTNHVHLPLVVNGSSSASSAGNRLFSAAVAETSGTASLGYDVFSGKLSYSVQISVDKAMTLTAVSLHSGDSGTNGPVLHTLFSGSTLVTDTLTVDGDLLLSGAEQDMFLKDGLYIEVKFSEGFPSRLRGQIVPLPVGDGAANQFYIDEMASPPFASPDNPEELIPYTSLLRYPAPAASLDEGVVAMAHRGQPTLENPGISYLGRSIYTSFGLEGVNNGVGATTREQLLKTMFDWAWDEPSVAISVTESVEASNLTILGLALDSNIEGNTIRETRWDFGDGSPIAGPYKAGTEETSGTDVWLNQVGHTYASCGTYTVRVEATDAYGNKTVGSEEITVTAAPSCGD